VIPTLVAHRVAPRKAWVCQNVEERSRRRRATRGRRARRPPAPPRGTRRALRVRMSRIVDSSPTRTGAPPTPIWREVHPGSRRDRFEPVHTGRWRLPRRTPARSSPRTAGCLRMTADVPMNFRGHEDHDEYSRSRDGGVLRRPRTRRRGTRRRAREPTTRWSVSFS